MKRQILIGAAVVLFLAGAVYANQPAYKPGVVLVRFANVNGQAPTKAAKIDIIKNALSCDKAIVKKEYQLVQGLTLVELPSETSVENAVASLRQSSSVLYAVPDYICHASAVPNDTNFTDLWAMRNTGQAGGFPGADIDAVNAWDISTGSSNIVVAVTDTGVDYTHPDLAANRWQNPGEIAGNGIDDDGDGFIDDVYGYDFINGDGDPNDDEGHGTHVSGTIGAVGNNNRGVVGVCWNVKIMAVKCLDANGAGSTSSIVSAVQYAILKQARVINASLSWDPGVPLWYLQPLYDAIAAAKDAGIIFVAAAGNDYGNNNDAVPVYPASFDLDNIISVMATTDTDIRAYFSNYGSTSVDIGAPGQFIFSTIPGGDYGYNSGTSMAAPHVTGACALLLSIDPSLSYIDAKNILINTVDPTLPALCVSGGRMNLAAAAMEAEVDTTPPTPPAWEMDPCATGLHTVTMEAKLSTDRAGVEYYFQCQTNGQSSGWQLDPLYSFTALNPGVTYNFRFKVRDRSESHNETDWSTTKSARTASGTDTLSPATGPSGWVIKPKVTRKGSTYVIRMQAKGYDESSPVQFLFYKYAGNTPDFNSQWVDNSVFDFAVGLNPNFTYRFACLARDASGNISNWSDDATATYSLSPNSQIRPVPVPYATIQAAIDASNNGDIVEISPGTYRGTGNWDISFKGKAITVRSIDPEDPVIVAATRIDCEEIIVIDGESYLIPHRGFIINRGEGRQSILEGLTIENGLEAGSFGMPGAPGNDGENAVGGAEGTPATSGTAGGAGGAGGDGTGAGIQIGTDPTLAPGNNNKESSPTIRNCVLRNCLVIGGFGGDGGDGGNGGDGAAGDGQGEPVIPAQPAGNGGNGGRGGNAGSGFGGGIYVSPSSNPLIQKCTVIDCVAVAGIAGDGGDGGNGGNGAVGNIPVVGGCGGSGGDGGDTRGANGGGIYVSLNSIASVVGCTFTNCAALLLTGQTNGTGGQPGISDPMQTCLEVLPGRDGLILGIAAGGGAFYKTNQGAGGYISISSCNFTQNYADNSGGGIGFDANNVRNIIVADCNIINNVANLNSGGGIYYEGGTLQPKGSLTMRNCTVTGNTVNGDGSVTTGGGLVAGKIFYPYPGADITIIDSYFSDNDADNGGAIYLDNADLTVENARLEDNASIAGGAINGYSSQVDITGSEIIANSAVTPYGRGGGIFLWNSLGSITNTRFKDNTADQFGGAILTTGGAAGPLELTNCLITDNSAVYEGGGLACRISAWAMLTNCTVADNFTTNLVRGVGGGISCAEKFAYVELYNSIVWGNSAFRGEQLAVGTGFGSYQYGDWPFADIYVSYSDVEGGLWQAFVENPTYTVVWWESTSFYSDPLFVSTSIDEKGYYLSQVAAGQLEDSPCLNAGNNDFADLSALTTRTDQVPDEGAIDVGYHYEIAAELPQYELTIEVVNDTGGTLTAQGFGSDPFTITAPAGRMVRAGTVVSLQALAGRGYKLLSWDGTDNDATTDANNAVTMNSNKVIRVTFYQFRLTIAVEALGGFPPDGQLSATGDADDPFTITARATTATRGVTPGTVVQLAAAADPGFRVQSWSGTDDDASTEPNNTVTMNSNKTVLVAFEPEGFYYLTVTIIGNGTVTPSGRTLQTIGKVVDIVAVPANPADTIIWDGTDDDNIALGRNSVTMNGQREVTVEFYRPRILNVGSSSTYPTIQAAIDVAHTRDIIQLMPSAQPYYTQAGFRIDGWDIGDITITSIDPYDPAVVAATVLEQQVGNEGGGVGSGLMFYGVGPLTRIQGITLRRFEAGDFTMPDPGEGVYDGLHGDDVRARGIVCYYSSPTFINVVIDDCHSFGDNGSNGKGGSGTEHPHGGNGGWPGGAWGGAVYLEGDPWAIQLGFPTNPTFINCTFSNNTAIGGDAGDGGNGTELGGVTIGIGGGGGGWYYNPNEIYSPWESPPEGLPKDHSGLGGAVYIGSYCSPKFEDCSFINNSSSGGLSGIAGPTPPANVRREPTIRYKIDNLGGAVYMKANSSAEFTDCIFTDNVADPSKEPNSNDGIVSFGGAVAVEDGATPVFKNCRFSGSIADIGGGVYASQSEIKIEDSNFISNTAIHGGGLIVSGGRARIHRDAFIDNDANAAGSEGAAIAIFGAGAEIIDSVLTDNNSLGHAGGIYASSRLVDGGEAPDQNNTVFVKNCLIANNTAFLGGAGITAVWHSDPNIVNCTITGNRSPGGRGGALYSAYRNYTHILNSIIWGNSAMIGREIAVGLTEEPSVVDVYYSDVNQTSGSKSVEPGCLLNFNAGVISDNPLFVGPTDYHLSNTLAGQSQTSPCVNTGSDLVSRFGLSTYTTRTDNFEDADIVDMGYHYRLPMGCLMFDYNGDGIVAFEDFAHIARSWLELDEYDLDEFAHCWLVGEREVPSEDTTAPKPDPMQWQTPPTTASETSVTMVAAIATDDSGGEVQYEFEETTGNTGATDSGWQISPIYTDIGLNAQNQYCYRVRARDEAGNVTGWSPTVCVTGLGDVTAPTPPIMVMGPNTISSDATTSCQFQWAFEYDWWHKIVVDVSTVVEDSGGPVEVKFICTDDGSLSSDSKIPAAQRPIIIGTDVFLGSKDDGWRLYFDGSTIVYDVYVNRSFGTGRTLNWKVCVYDLSNNQSCSQTHTIGPQGI